MKDFLEVEDINLKNRIIQNSTSNRTIVTEISRNTSNGKLIYYNDEKLEEEIKKYRKMKIVYMINEINSIICHDEYIDGELSHAEIFMREELKNNQVEYVVEALMQIYSNNLSNVHILEGILVMISSVPYEIVVPKGQVMAMGLLSNRELSIRDRAIQCFERWNSKKGLAVLRSLDCQPKWLQNYVDKVIMYIERDGVE